VANLAVLPPGSGKEVLSETVRMVFSVTTYASSLRMTEAMIGVGVASRTRVLSGEGRGVVASWFRGEDCSSVMVGVEDVRGNFQKSNPITLKTIRSRIARVSHFFCCEEMVGRQRKREMTVGREMNDIFVLNFWKGRF
jgi:hypothetical protein